MGSHRKSMGTPAMKRHPLSHPNDRILSNQLLIPLGTPAKAQYCDSLCSQPPTLLLCIAYNNSGILLEGCRGAFYKKKKSMVHSVHTALACFVITGGSTVLVVE